MIRILLALVILIFASSPARADGEYIFILAAHDNPYWQMVGEGIKDAAAAQKIAPVIYEAQNSQDAEGELNLCLTAIERKPKIIVMGSLNSSVGIQCFKKAGAAGIMTADIDATLPVAEAAQAGVKLAFSVGSDNFAIGQKAGEYAARIAGKPDPKFLILEGLPGSVPGKKRVDGFRSRLQQLMPAAILVASIPAEWDRLKAMNIVNDTLQRQPDLDLIYTANDTMALGAVEAVRNAGKSSQIKIIGVDGSQDARKAIEQGRLTASVAQLPYLMGKRVAERAVAALHGAAAGVTEVTPALVLTKPVLDANQDPLLRYVR